MMGADVLGGARFVVRLLQAQLGAILVHGRGESPGQSGPVFAVGRGTLDDLVVDVGDIAHIGHRVSQRAQVALHQIEHRQHARMSDVDVVVVGHAADVHAHLVRNQGLEFLFLARQ